MKQSHVRINLSRRKKSKRRHTNLLNRKKPRRMKHKRTSRANYKRSRKNKKRVRRNRQRTIKRGGGETDYWKNIKRDAYEFPGEISKYCEFVDATNPEEEAFGKMPAYLEDLKTLVGVSDPCWDPVLLGKNLNEKILFRAGPNIDRVNAPWLERGVISKITEAFNLSILPLGDHVNPGLLDGVVLRPGEEQRHPYTIVNKGPHKDFYDGGAFNPEYVADQLLKLSSTHGGISRLIWTSQPELVEDTRSPFCVTHSSFLKGFMMRLKKVITGVPKSDLVSFRSKFWLVDDTYKNGLEADEPGNLDCVKITFLKLYDTVYLKSITYHPTRQSNCWIRRYVYKDTSLAKDLNASLDGHEYSIVFMRHCIACHNVVDKRLKKRGPAGKYSGCLPVTLSPLLERDNIRNLVNDVLDGDPAKWIPVCSVSYRTVLTVILVACCITRAGMKAVSTELQAVTRLDRAQKASFQTSAGMEQADKELAVALSTSQDSDTPVDEFVAVVSEDV